MSFHDVAVQLREVRWGHAAEWDAAAQSWLHAYYRRLLPHWPEERSALEPTDRAIEERALGRCTDEERAHIASEVRAVIDAARGRRERIEATTQKLLSFMLAWALAVDAGELEPDADPGVPLMKMFRAGYQISYSDAGIELHYTGGWMISRVPTRAAMSGS